MTVTEQPDGHADYFNLFILAVNTDVREQELGSREKSNAISSLVARTVNRLGYAVLPAGELERLRADAAAGRVTVWGGDDTSPILPSPEQAEKMRRAVIDYMGEWDSDFAHHDDGVIRSHNDGTKYVIAVLREGELERLRAIDSARCKVCGCTEALRQAAPIKDWSLALQSLTPGGSEYVDDPERCVAFVRETRESQHQTIVRQALTARRQAVLIDTIRTHAAAHRFVDTSGTGEVSDMDAIRYALARYDAKGAKP